MSACTFFGHRDCSAEIVPRLREAILALVADRGVDLFYVGHQGKFDAIVRRVLCELQQELPQLRYAVVLAYPPGMSNALEDYSDTMLPEGIETVHPRYAISRRNDWMLQRSDYVITYITHSWGGAAQYAKKALRLKKTVIPLCDAL